MKDIDPMREIDPHVKPASQWVIRVILIGTLAMIVLSLLGCASPYQTRHSTPYIQFPHEGRKEILKTPRQIYFNIENRRAVDNMIGICLA